MADTVDVETGFDSGKQHGTSFGRPARLELELTEAAGVFLAWSVLVIVEGVIRTVRNAHPGETGDLTPPGVFPPLALLLGGIAEVAFGAAGIVLALAILVFKLRNSNIVTGFLIFQSILGWFVFITYVLAEPLYKLDNLEAGGFGFSRGQHRFLIFLGILTSISWCAALQSGQFVLAARCRTMMKGRADTVKMHKLRACVWSFFVALAGFAMILDGAIVLGNATGSSPFLPPPVFPPHVNVYPESILVCGIITLIWGLLGMAASITAASGLLKAFNYTWFPVFFANVIVFALMLGRVPDGGPAFAAAQHTVLSFAFTVLPLVFTRKLVEWEAIGRHAVGDE